MKNEGWYAWINYMPPPPDEFHVVGRVLASNPGIEATLVRREPQGINPTILMLDLFLVQKPGMWPMVLTWTQVRLDEVLAPDATHYKQVSIHLESNPMITVDVNEVR